MYYNGVYTCITVSLHISSYKMEHTHTMHMPYNDAVNSIAALTKNYQIEKKRSKQECTYLMMMMIT